jgi:hypothetical protein
MADFDDWDKNEAGHLKAWPMLGFATAVFPNGKGGLRLEVGAPPKPGDPTAAVQVAFTEEQLRALSDALLDVADRIAGSAKDMRRG